MQKNSRIFVAGHRGLVGSAIIRRLKQDGYENLILKTRQELDLRNQSAVQELFKKEAVEFVFFAAAKVGGIHANNTYPAEFIYDNLMVAANVIHASYASNVEKLLFLGSSCIYPKLAPQPIKEESLLTGPLEPTNEAYAIAKIAGLKMCEMYHRQYGKRFISAMPTNLYGPNDNFHPDNSHVIPGMMRRFHEAKLRDDKQVVVWGTGKPMREFLHVDDLAEALVLLMQIYEDPLIINVGSGVDITIRELAEFMKAAIQYEGEVIFDSSKPDGTPKKVMDISKIRALDWAPKKSLKEGLSETYRWAVENRAL